MSVAARAVAAVANRRWGDVRTGKRLRKIEGGAAGKASAEPQAPDPYVLQAINPREASMFASITDAIVGPEPVYPPVRETTATVFFDEWMARSPGVNRLALRGMLYAAEVAPILLGFGRRLRRLQAEHRERFVVEVESSRNLMVHSVAKLLKAVTTLSYYGDDRVLKAVGYDPDENIARARRLRKRDGRP